MEPINLHRGYKGRCNGSQKWILLFLMEQLDKMIGEDPQKLLYCSKKLEGGEKFKPTDSEDDPHNLLVGHTVKHNENVMEKLKVKNTCHNTAPESTVLVDTDPNDLENDDEEQEHFKKLKRNDSAKEKASKPPEFFDTDSEDSDVHDNILRDMYTISRINIQHSPSEEV